jgi:hypothetical protein
MVLPLQASGVTGPAQAGATAAPSTKTDAAPTTTRTTRLSTMALQDLEPNAFSQ